MGGGGGGKGVSYSTPVVAEPEKAQTSKSVTEAATAARDSQKDKASKAAGLQGSILTSPVTSDSSGNTLLGQ